MSFNIFKLFSSNKKKLSRTFSDAELTNLIKNEISISITDKTPMEKGSKIGGNPYLPPDFKWPYYNGADYDGIKKPRPLSFLAQISLNEIRPLDKEGKLPANGMLYFFYEIETMKWGFDPDDDGCARVYYFEKTDGFTVSNAPNELLAEHILPELALEFSSGNSLPSYEELSIHIPEFFENSDYEDYEAILTKLNIAYENCERNKLLGYADLIQGEALTDCEATSRSIYMGDGKEWNRLSAATKSDITKHASDWILLFQMSSICDTEPEIMWGDMGNLYFYVRKDDLAAQRFDKVKITLQCG